MPTLTKTTKVLRHFGVRYRDLPGGHNVATVVAFSREPDEPGGVPAAVELPLGAWADLGEPKAITVTIEPGDLLND